MGWQHQVVADIRQWMQESGNDPEAALAQCGSDYERLILHAQLACNNDATKIAIRSFKACLDVSPEPYAAYCALGRIYMVQGDFSRALKFTHKAAELRTDEFKLLLMHLYLLVRQNKDKAMIEQLNQAVQNYVLQQAQRLGIAIDPAENFWEMRTGNRLWLNAAKTSNRKAYKAQKHTVLEQVLPTACFELMAREHAVALAEDRLMPEPALKRKVISDAPISALANYQLAQMVAQVIERNVIPTYSFSIHYLPGGFIKPHVDRPQNELSMSLSIGTSPGCHSSLGAGEGETAQRFDLQPNQGMFYRGCEVTHFREPVPDGHAVDQMIFGFRTVHRNHCYCG